MGSCVVCIPMLVDSGMSLNGRGALDVKRGGGDGAWLIGDKPPAISC